MKTSNVWKLLAVLILLAARARAGEMHDTVTNYRGYVMAQWAPVVAPASITNTAGGAFAATGTWHYALAAANSLGESAAGPVTNVTVATGNLVRITWRPAGGATNYLIYRGTAATSLTERAVVGLTTSYVDHGTNAWTTNSPASTITNVPALILAGPATDPLGAVTKAQAEALIGATGAVTMAELVASNAVLAAGISNAQALATQANTAATNADLKAQGAGVAATQALSVATSASNAAAAVSAAKIGYQDSQGFTNGASGHFTNAAAELVVGAGDPTHYGYGRIWIPNARDVNIDAGSMSGDWQIGGSVLDNIELAGLLNIYLTNIVHAGVPIFRLGKITTNALAAVNGSGLTNLAADTLGGLPAASYALLASISTVGRYTNFPATATAAGSAGQWAVTNIGSTNWLAVWGANFQGTGTNGWGFMQLQRARP
jgi:hypothetical protein